MSIQVGWYIPNKVNYMKVNGKVSDKTFIEAANFRADLANSSSEETVHLIVDASESEFNINISAYNDFKLPDNNGWTIVVGNYNRVARFAGTVVMQLVKQELRFVDSIDEAMATLVKVDASVTDYAGTEEITIGKEFN
ncbi:MAG: hypothetical protein AAFV93_16935 [Chloroflexota bacterium]